MTHQVAMTISIPVRADGVESLAATLATIGADPGSNAILPFGTIEGLHFARIVLLPADSGLDGVPLPPRLLFLLDCDAPEGRRLREVVRVAGDHLDQVLDHCEGYPLAGGRGNRQRYTFLRKHIIRTDVSYVNTRGRPLSQVREEAALRDAIQAFLDEPQHRWSRLTAVEAREAIREFVGSREDLGWALQRAPGPGLAGRLREKLHLGLNALRLLLAAPFALAAGPAYAFVLRRREKTDPAPRLAPDYAHVERLAADEDHLAVNQFTAVGHLKPGRFRMFTAVAILYMVNLGTRHLYDRGTLTGVKTIHMARWVFLDERRRLLFASNYDGSLENYMDDFIDKVAWGLNAVFSNGMEFPRTNWLVRDGAKDELAFKNYIRVRQVPSNVWYTANGHLTNANLAQNARIRAGLSGEMEEQAAAEWLRLL